MEDIIFADCEGNDFLPGLTRMWTMQIAQGVDTPVVVYADQPGYPPIAEALHILKNAKQVVFHFGLGFDFWAINKLYPGALRREQIIDSVVISRMINAQSKNHSLADLGSALGYKKFYFDDFSKFTPEMATYGRRDVEILQKAWKGDPARKVASFGKFYTKYKEACDLEFHVQYIIAKQEQHGFRFDMKAAGKLEGDLRQEYLDIERSLQVIFPPIVHERYSERQVDKITGKPKRLKDYVEVFNPGSRQQIADRLIAKYGWKPKKFTPTKRPEVNETILSELPYPEAKEVAKYLDLEKKLGLITSWIKLAVQHEDGEWYVHGYVNTLGARTHRMSHSGPNMAQVPSDHRFRALFLPDLGQIQVGVDAEGLELRMLSHYLFPYDNGRYATAVHSGDKTKGTDIHSVNRKVAELFSREWAKTMIYAHNYGCFDPKLGQIVVDDAKEAGKPVPAGSLSSIGSRLRKKLAAGTPGLDKLINKCKDMHAKRGALPGLDGRWIMSASDHSALNTLLQGNGSVVMKKALVIFDEALKLHNLSDKVSYLANVHDEFQVSCSNGIAAKVADLGKWSITRAGEVLGVRCPLVGDAKIGNNWAECH